MIFRVDISALTVDENAVVRDYLVVLAHYGQYEALILALKSVMLASGAIHVFKEATMKRDYSNRFDKGDKRSSESDDEEIDSSQESQEASSQDAQ